MKNTWETLLVAILGSGALSAGATQLLNRRKARADVTDINVKTALALEERAIERYHGAAEALASAQRALDAAREEVIQLELYIQELHRLLDKAGIPYPKMPGTRSS